MNECGKSDNSNITYEATEQNRGTGCGGGGGKGNTTNLTRPGPSAAQGVSNGCDRVREVARKDKDAKFTPLLHHIDLDRLEVAYRAINQESIG